MSLGDWILIISPILIVGLVWWILHIINRIALEALERHNDNAKRIYQLELSIKAHPKEGQEE